MGHQVVTPLNAPKSEARPETLQQQAQALARAFEQLQAQWLVDAFERLTQDIERSAQRQHAESRHRAPAR